jgi:hypothetical protein
VNLFTIAIFTIDSQIVYMDLKMKSSEVAIVLAMSMCLFSSCKLILHV